MNQAHTTLSAVECVDALIERAIACAASDIHIESTHHDLRIRYRIDGVLHEQESLDEQIALQVLSRIKIMANINIAEKRVPQDGKFCLTHNDHVIDLRVSTFPSLHGEKVVIRILDRSKNMIDLDHLGFSSQMFSVFTTLIERSSGFFLVVGPTGSGKTTTLYAALSYINSPEKNVVTLEDPVEYNVDGITQGQIYPPAGFTFESGMRALLRQDPDIAMVGEIRDQQTAAIAIEAALTGHLVLSTLHTGDAPSAIVRLMDMGIEPFLINAAVTGVLAQRLARKICTDCCEQYQPTKQEHELLATLKTACTTLYRGAGCNACNHSGYRGRIGIFELLEVSSALRALIVQHPVVDDIYAQALRDGMMPLINDGLQKVEAGQITLQELLRVVG